MRRLLVLLPLLLTSCYHASVQIEPCLPEPVHPKEMCSSAVFSDSPFPPMTTAERESEWGKEWVIGLSFAADFDLYRAITAFKRALILMPQEEGRRCEIEYDIALSYFLGHKYADVISTVEGGPLACVDDHFPAWRDLLLLLYDSYKHMGAVKKQECARELLEKCDHAVGRQLALLTMLETGDICALEQEGLTDPSRGYLVNIADGYCSCAKSVRSAEMFNALLPGSGYWYVGQKQSAITSFLINSLFITAAIQFISHGYTALGVITFSLEAGWYFGGIYGGGLAAKSYNEHLFESYACKVAACEPLYPLLMLRYTY